MPGLVIASRRWNIGSDDLVLPATIYLIAHLLWISIYGVISWQNDSIFFDQNCSNYLTLHIFGELCLMIGFVLLELIIIKISCQGSILNGKSRSLLNPLLYIGSVLFLFGIIWDVYGWSIIILDRKNLAGKRFQFTCSRKTREQIYALKIYLLFIWMSFIIFIWCAFDYAGRSWVKMKRFQESLNNPNSKHKYRRSNSFHRNWRHREALRKYEKSWINRCRMCCCIRDHRRDNSFADIAKLLSEFFRDIDVVPSDIIAGLSLMRVQQKSIRKKLFEDSINPKIFQFLSGTPITAETKFLDLTHPLVIKEIYNLIHYFHYSMAIYGWPVYMVTNKPIEWFRLIRNLEPCSNNRCHCCVQCFSFSNWYCCYCFRVENDSEQPNDYEDDERFIGDNCCLCNRAAIRQTCRDHHYKIIFLTYEVGVERPPFFVAVDYEKISIVISIRGTLSLSDVMTDLNADYEQLPIKEPKESWFGHKGIVSAASYIRSKLIEKNAIEIANEELKRKNSQTNCSQFPIIVVGHSLGAGTAAILAVLLREIYRNVICFAYAPPGGLLSEEVINYSKDFIVSIVLGKDLVPRLGLHQMEKLRFDLIKSIKHCDMSKWSIILKSCCLSRKEFSLEEFTKKFKMNWQTDRLELATDRNKITKEIISTHPNDESISLTVHTPLYPPGSIIHLVKAYPNKNDLLDEPKWRKIISQKQTVIQAMWAGPKDFDEILISPSMISDHMPDKILEAMQSLLVHTGPPKPARRLQNDNDGNDIGDETRIVSRINKGYDDGDGKNSSLSNSSGNPRTDESSDRTIILETSFANVIDAEQVDEKRSQLQQYREKKDELYAKEELFNEERLKRLRSLISKCRAPLATPETVSLSEQKVNEDVVADIILNAENN